MGMVQIDAGGRTVHMTSGFIALFNDYPNVDLAQVFKTNVTAPDDAPTG
jgi:hypothetical protein